jgi:predicted small secreted protein
MIRKARAGVVNGKTIAAMALLAAVIACSAGCNTTEGVGKDIESAGDGIKDAARDAKQ